jgi:hypothetical protein
MMVKKTTVSPEILHRITGKLLGDGCITKQKRRNPRFQFIHTTSDKEWCFYCYELLKDYLPFTAPYYRRIKDNRVLKGYTESFQVQSSTDPLITCLESIWYDNRKKVIPFAFLEQNLNEQALAWWYQDDGHLNKVDNIPKKIILSTDNFTTTENLGLIDLLTKKFSLYFKLDSQNRILLYDQLQIYYFLHLVDPYMHPSMNRKIISPTQKLTTRKRTTIYLPNNILLTKPTAEINQQLEKLNILEEIVMDRTRYIKFYKNILADFRLTKETKGFQIVINEKYNSLIQMIRKRTGLTVSQVITICFMLKS